MDLRGIGVKGVDWLQFAELKLVESCCECGDEHFGSIKGREFLDQLSELPASQEELCSVALLGY
jgi:hypothetical protein